MNAQTFFSTEEKQRIEATVRKAERRTSGEIVPMVVDACYDYPRAEIIGAGCFSLGTACLLSWLFWGASLWAFLALFLPGYFAFIRLIRSLPGLKRRLIHPEEIRREVEERAMVAFLEHNLHQTRDRTGILILISLFEHRVQVLADSGINALVPPHAWEEIVALVTLGIKEGNACECLCQAVERCGNLLESGFPQKEDDRDELPNLVLS